MLTKSMVGADEHNRLDIQHRKFRAKMGRLYWPQSCSPVRRILAPRPGGRRQPAIIDTGTGLDTSSTHSSVSGNTEKC